MNTQEAKDELLVSLDEHQLNIIRVMLSILQKAWSILKATLTPRQKELLMAIGKDRSLSEIINDIEEMR